MINILNKLVGVVYAVQVSDGDSAGGAGPALIPADPVAGKFSDVGDVVTKLLPYVYVMAGLVLLVMLIAGGLTLMTAAGNPDKIKSGYGRITMALVGFLIIFISYFVVQLVEIIFGVAIL